MKHSTHTFYASLTYVLTTAAVLPGLCGCGDDDGDSGTDAATGLDGASDTCVLDTGAAPTKIALFTAVTRGGSANTAQSEQGPFAVNEINQGCGMLGTSTSGIPVELIEGDSQDDSGIATQLVTDAVADGAAFVIGSGGSGVTTPSAPIAIQAGIPFAAFAASADSLNGCTANQIADPAVVKTDTPVLEDGMCWNHMDMFFRTAINSTDVGNALAQYALETHTAARRFATLYRNDGFGVPHEAEFVRAVEAAGDGRSASQRIAFEPGATVDDFLVLLPMVVQDDPEVIETTSRVGELRAIYDAYVQLTDDSSFTKPAGWDSIQFVHAGSVRGDYTDLGNEARMVMSTRATGVQPHWDTTSDAFTRWRDAYLAFDPDSSVRHHQQMRTYDAFMIFALASVQAGSSNGSEIAAEVSSIANPPGTQVFPGEYARARALILEGEEIDYEGASGSVNLNEIQNVTESPYQVWRIDATGALVDVETFNPT